MVLAKAPLPGTVKTRLVPPLTAREAAALGAAMLRDTLARIVSIAREGDADCIIAYAPSDARSSIARLAPQHTVLLAQRGEDLGARLPAAFDDARELGYGHVIFVGADSPTLPAATLRAARDALAARGDRAVLAAAYDGGYVLLGIKARHTELFTSVPWGSARVASATRARAAAIGLAVCELAPWYDVDDAAALARLQAEIIRDPAAAPATHAWFAQRP